MGAEALVRWEHPERGVVLPGEFIAAAEESGFILPLGLWILDTACKQLAEWGARPMTPDFKLAVNVSASQFRQAEFVQQVVSTLRKTGADPHRLTLELTESVLLHNVEEVIEKMSALKKVGVNFALDDFGTGYFLAVLLEAPAAGPAEDRPVVRTRRADRPGRRSDRENDRRVGSDPRLKVIADGIETSEQRNFLAGNGCHHHQGYLFSRPLSVQNFNRFAWHREPIRPLLEATG